MGTYKRLPRGKKKPANELMTFAEKCYALFHKRWKAVLAVCVFTIALLVAIIGGYRYMNWRSAEAFNALAAARDVADQTARSTALVGVTEDYRGTAAAREAALVLGNTALGKGAFEEALKWFEQLSERSHSYPILQVYALIHQGRAYEEMGKYEEASRAYRTATRIKGNLIKGQTMYDEARCLEKLGAYDEAKERYREALEEAGESDVLLKAKSEERLLWLIANRHIAG